MPSFPVLPESGGFFISGLLAGLSNQNPSAPTAETLKDQLMLRRISLSMLALAGFFVLSPSTVHAKFASSVVSSVPGTGVSSFYTNPAAALGEPSRVTPGEYGGPIDPFNPAYMSSQLVSIGAGG